MHILVLFVFVVVVSQSTLAFSGSIGLPVNVLYIMPKEIYWSFLECPQVSMCISGLLGSPKFTESSYVI